MSSAFYRTPQWQQLRAKHLYRYPYCVVCIQLGMRVRGSHVDHVNPIALGGPKMQACNLQTLCHTHHSQKTAHGMEHGSHTSCHAFNVIGADGYSVPAGAKPFSDPDDEHT